MSKNNFEREVLIAPQEGPQTTLCTAPTNVDQILYGGALGGGKSFSILIKWMQHIDICDAISAKREHEDAAANGLVCRFDLEGLDELIDDARAVFEKIGAVWHAQKRVLVFPQGHKIKFAHIKDERSFKKHQGKQYTFIAIDEAGQFNTAEFAQIDKLYSRLRNKWGFPSVFLLTANPGGPGHHVLKTRFIDPGPENTVITKEIKFDGKTATIRRMFIPSLLADNKYLGDDYAQKLLASDMPEWQKKAWLSGSWDIVAGGMFEDVFDRKKIVIKSPEYSWFKGLKLDRSFDWGSTSPFAVLWHAELDGDKTVEIDGKEVTPPRGSLMVFDEWYGSNGKPNEGLNLAAFDVGKGIMDREKKMERVGGIEVKPGPADTQIYNNLGAGNSYAKEMQKAGCNWTEVKKAGGRELGWQLMREMMKATTEMNDSKPWLIICDRCTDLIRVLPTLERDTNHPDDIKKSEDHNADALRYKILKMRGPQSKTVKTSGLM